MSNTNIHMPARTVNDIFLFLESSDEEAEERQGPYIDHISIQQLKPFVSYFECNSLSPLHRLIYIIYNYSFGVQKGFSYLLSCNIGHIR